MIFLIILNYRVNKCRTAVNTILYTVSAAERIALISAEIISVMIFTKPWAPVIIFYS